MVKKEPVMAWPKSENYKASFIFSHPLLAEEMAIGLPRITALSESHRRGLASGELFAQISRTQKLLFFLSSSS